MRLTPWSLFILMAIGIIVNIPVSLLAQSQPIQQVGQLNTEEEVKQKNLQVLRLYMEGNYIDAINLAERTLAIAQKILGKEHLELATSLENLALLYQVQGNYQPVEPLLQRALVILEKVRGKEHPEIARILNNLAQVYQVQGNFQQAELLLQRSLLIAHKVLGKEHLFVAQNLYALASLYFVQGNFQQAEPLFKRVLTILEKQLGKEQPLVASTLDGLASLYQAQGRHQQAEPLYKRSLAIREKAPLKENPDIVTTLHGLAYLYQTQGRHQQAEALYKRSLAILEKLQWKKHPLAAQSLQGLAQVYQVQGDIKGTTDFLRRQLEIEEHNLALLVAVGSEQRKQSYVSTFAITTDFAISLGQKEGRNHPTAAKLALTTVLRRKGRVLDAVTDSTQILRSQLGKNSEVKKLFDEWLNILQQQSALVYGEQGQQTSAQYVNRFKQLEAQRQDLEVAINAKSARFRTETQPVELAPVQAAIPQDAALVEIVHYYPFNAKAKNQNEELLKPRYAAAILRSKGEPKWIDLGDAATIDKLVFQTRTALKNSTSLTEVKKLTRQLDEQLMAPIRPLLGNARHLLISPDGQLTLVPFEALRSPEGEYLIERYTFSYLTSGRDLLRFQSFISNASSPVVFADIDYNQQDTIAATPKTTIVNSTQNRRSADLASLNFEPLAATKEEGQQIKAIFPDTKLLYGKQATETAVKKLQSPRILHLATHGFFLPDTEVELPLDKFNQQQPKFLKLENPLLRSGVVLAGFNNRHKSVNNDDGVLTALEVAGLNLHSSQLIVLSACETGLGDTKVGEGVYGLRRALVIAGSQSQILSLWLVDDTGTKDLMVKYYQGLKAGKGRHEALRSSTLR